MKRKLELNEIAVVCSHINTLYESVFLDSSDYAKSHEFVLIMEDDARFHYQIDFKELISSVKKDFGMLQLLMSLSDDIIKAYGLYLNNKHQLWTERLPDSTVWSAQAYIVNKTAIKPILQHIIGYDRNNNVGFKLANTLNYDKKNQIDTINPFKPVVPSQCLFADMYLYSLTQPQPVFILTIPLLNGAGIGMNTTLHNEHVSFHAYGFMINQKIQTKFNQNINLLPNFVKIFKENRKFIEKQVNWTEISLNNPRIVYPDQQNRVINQIELSLLS